MPLARTWGAYFPAVKPGDKDRYPYPIPNSDEFWGIYREPARRFEDEARWLLAVIIKLETLLPPEIPVEVISPGPAEETR